MPANNFIAGGTINPSTFVKASTAADNTALACTSGDKAIGIATPSQELAPIPANSASTYAAAVGDPITVFGLGDICLLIAGSGGYTHGDFLKPDTTGAGVAGTSGDYVSAVAFETTAYGSYGRVQIVGPCKL